MTNSQPTTFALYHYDSCPYCSKTRRSIDELGVEVELRNIKLNHQHQLELLQGGRKTQVPCLRIGKLTGESQWLYESDDIIDYLSRYQKELFRLTRMA
jgi:glutathione S-transferase